MTNNIDVSIKQLAPTALRCPVSVSNCHIDLIFMVCVRFLCRVERDDIIITELLLS